MSQTKDLVNFNITSELNLKLIYTYPVDFCRFCPCAFCEKRRWIPYSSSSNLHSLNSSYNVHRVKSSSFTLYCITMAEVALHVFAFYILYRWECTSFPIVIDNYIKSVRLCCVKCAFCFFCFCFRQLNQFRHSHIVPEYIEYAGLNHPYSLPVPFVRTKVSKVSLSVIFPQNCYGTGNLEYPSPITDILMHSNLWTISNIFSWPGKKMYWKL